MISESYYWKNGLIKLASKLRRLSRRKNPSELVLAHFEQHVMIGFYSIRKLIESSKLSDTIATQTIDLEAFSSSGKNVTRMNCHRLEELYSLETPSVVQSDLLFVCNQIIHSYAFFPLLKEENGGLAGILFNSDRSRHNCVFQLGLERIIELFRQVGNDYPNRFSAVYDPEKQDYLIRQSTDCTESG